MYGVLAEYFSKFMDEHVRIIASYLLAPLSDRPVVLAVLLLLDTALTADAQQCGESIGHRCRETLLCSV